MNKKYPTRNEAIAMFSAVVSTSALFQIVRGWNTLDFFGRLLVSTLAALMVWRVRPLIVENYFQGTSKARHRFIWHVMFWVVIAIVLFFVFRVLK